MKNKLGILLLFLVACSTEKTESTKTSSLPEKRVQVPGFNADSAYAFIEQQVAFGPRVPNTPAHRRTGDFIVEKLETYGAVVQEQRFSAMSFDNQNLALRNIIASFQPEKTKRILLAAHWDTRPFADKDSEENRTRPIDGANDGASGVGVLLEIARVLHADTSKLDVGIDMIFFDGEDWGDLIYESRPSLPPNLKSWYCLGSQYWSENKHKANYSAYYGVLLDMVGAKGATFRMEGHSMNFAPSVTRKVWDWANSIGYGTLFLYDQKQEIIDDHYFVNSVANIPMINIVHFDDTNGYFGDYHHSLKDNMSIIDRQVLKGVGETLLHVLYHE